MNAKQAKALTDKNIAERAESAADILDVNVKVAVDNGYYVTTIHCKDKQQAQDVIDLATERGFDSQFCHNVHTNDHVSVEWKNA